MNDTPRTDQRIFKMLSPLQSGTQDVVHADFSRELERELRTLALQNADLLKDRERLDWLEKKYASAVFNPHMNFYQISDVAGSNMAAAVLLRGAIDAARGA